MGNEAGGEAPPNLIHVAFPEKITAFVGLAMAIGLVLAASAFLPWAIREPWSTPSSVLLGAGIGIVLSAFGGQATLRGKAYIFTGVAAIAIALIWFLEYQRHREYKDKTDRIAAFKSAYARGAVYDISDRYSVSIRFNQPILGRQDTVAKQYDFIVIGEETRAAGAASLNLDRRDDG